MPVAPIIRRGILPLSLAACALLASVGPVRSFIDCCFAGYVPPMLTAFLLPARSAEDGSLRASALGFRPKIDDLGMARAALDHGYLTWGPGGSEAYCGIAAPSGRPFVAPRMYLLCGHATAPDRPMGSESGASHPNGALQVTGAFAVVSDLDSSCSAIQGQVVNPTGWPIQFGPRVAVPALSATCRTAAMYDGTTLTVLTPDGAMCASDGMAERWLAGTGPRWLGFSVSVGDLHHTASLLTDNRVLLAEIKMWGSTCLLVEPDGSGGPVVVFHEVGAPPFRGVSRLP